jgi:DeoR/GlpR family transcriptional regulator of sugar metabolism
MTTQRRAKIRQYIQSKGEAQLTELASLFPSVSSMTLRRDLDYLERHAGHDSINRTSLIKFSCITI